MKLLNDFLKEYATPVAKSAGFKKKGTAFRIDASSGDVAFLEFSPFRIDSTFVVFHAQCFIVPEPYWQWMNRQYLAAGVPEPNSSGAIAAFSVVPPPQAAHTPEAGGLARTRWAFDENTRQASGKILSDVLRSDVVPRIRHLLVRENLLDAIRSTESPSIRRWGALESEIVLMVDEYSRHEMESLLSELDDSSPLKKQFTEWADMRRSKGA
ncbi:hypothetical protein [Streptomyces sp. SLBN-118]|uniref:hypothetical protein n=1 Tax=Streptomyces sp. SLBN-118 TaxID=2768454 RepID=UPI0011530BA2|nr:hypothetical protein [Streptomyces sp. SLBN-118]